MIPRRKFVKKPMRDAPLRYSLVAAGLAALVIMSLFAACSSPAAQATATPTKTPRPVATQVAAAQAAAAAPTEAPSPTAEPPTAAPTVTAAPAATEEATPAAETAASAAQTQVATEAVAEQAAASSSAIIPREAGVSIFTGLRSADPAVLNRRPLAIKVDNDLAVVPQSGLSKADVVVESAKEGCLTRFTAIYQSQDAPRVGSIRSARIVDKELGRIFDAIVAFSGGVEPVRQMLYKSDLSNQLLEQARNGKAFFRDPNIRVPFNLFANTGTLWNYASQKGWNVAPNPTTQWAFSEGAPAGGAAAAKLAIPYPKAYQQLRVSWSYNPGSGRWLRFIGGKPHVDKVDGQQLSAANVIVLTANHVQTLIPEQGTKLGTGPCSNASVEIQLWGEGKARILRDGQVFEGKWVRAGRNAPFRFIDSKGQDIPLKPGNSWIQLVATDMPVTISK
jgi:hypothetical protein